MTAYRSQAIREVETELAASRARGMLKHEGITWSQWKAERAKWRRLTLKVAGWALFVMVAFAFAVHLVLR
jgi:disulfide bond formation protein DsbB